MKLCLTEPPLNLLDYKLDCQLTDQMEKKQNHVQRNPHCLKYCYVKSFSMSTVWSLLCLPVQDIKNQIYVNALAADSRQFVVKIK